MAFDEFWSTYPRKLNKAQALKAYNKAIKRLSDAGFKDGPEIIRRAAHEYAEYARGTEPRFICHAATWLNQSRYENNYAEERNNNARKSKAGHGISAAFEIMQEEEIRPDMVAGGTGTDFPF